MLAPTTLGRRICVVGTSGSGKTFVAEALAARLGLRYICNDAIIWGPHWTPTPPEERLARFDAETSEDGWTYDGNIGASADDQLMLSRCDTLVWLDLPRLEVWSQMLRRTLWRVISREPLWHGNVETWRMMFSRDSIILWSIQTLSRRRRAYTALFADPAHAGRTRVHLHSRREVDRWLASLPARA